MRDVPEVVGKVIAKGLTYLSAEKLTMLLDAIDALDRQGIRGDLAEFGLALGGSAICIASKLGPERSFYGFDNFDLIPAPEPIDGERVTRRYEVIKSGKSPGIGSARYYGYTPNRHAQVKTNFAELGLPVDGDRIVLVEGLFKETLPQSLRGPVAFAHIDCDWYAPVKLCLLSLFPRLPVGGAVVVDDYKHWEGCTKATDEFCAAHPQMEIVPHGTSATLTRRSA
jgi:asparagine synthase (glutamine-hydrolysing)